MLMIGLIIVLIRSVKIDLRSKDGTDETIINTDSVEKNTTLLPATMMLIIINIIFCDNDDSASGEIG